MENAAVLDLSRLRRGREKHREAVGGTRRGARTNSVRGCDCFE